MDHLSGCRQRLWDAMESCGSDDLCDPQFAELAARLAEDPKLCEQFQRLQEADRAIKAAFADVSVPVGLADRVSQQVAEAAQRAAGPGPIAALDSVAERTATPLDGPTPIRDQTMCFSRRRLLVGFTALSAAAALFAAVWVETHPPGYETPDKLLDEAMDFFSNDNQPGSKLISQTVPPAEYPLSRDIVRLQDIRWRYVESFPGGRAVAYDLPALGGRATLYVLQRNVSGLPSIPPDRPISRTGGKSAAAWQAGTGLLYVLVVEGDAGMYSSYLDQSHGPLT